MNGYLVIFESTGKVTKISYPTSEILQGVKDGILILVDLTLESVMQDNSNYYIQDFNQEELDLCNQMLDDPERN